MKWNIEKWFSTANFCFLKAEKTDRKRMAFDYRSHNVRKGMTRRRRRIATSSSSFFCCSVFIAVKGVVGHLGTTKWISINCSWFTILPKWKWKMGGLYEVFFLAAKKQKKTVAQCILGHPKNTPNFKFYSSFEILNFGIFYQFLSY